MNRECNLRISTPDDSRKRMTQQLDVIHLILEQQGLLVLLGGKKTLFMQD